MIMIKTETIELTPEMAVDLLASAAQNRNPSRKLVSAYTRDIEEGRWTLNGESVKVNTGGQMFDGKHRCLAVVAAGKPITTVIAWDADEENVDVGRPRTYSDTLAIAGMPSSRNLGAAVTAITVWQAGGRPGIVGQFRPTVTEKNKTLSEHPEIPEIVRIVNVLRPHIPVAPSILSLCYWLFNRISPEETQGFMEDVAGGAGLEEGNAALTLRNRLVKEWLARRGPLNDKDAAALIIMAWNAYRDRRPMKKLQLANPLTLEKFPQPH
jgi:hypothetical protein